MSGFETKCVEGPDSIYNCRTCGLSQCSCICNKCGYSPCDCFCIACNAKPCSCGMKVIISDAVNLNPSHCTVMAPGANTRCNIWYEPGGNGYAGKCKLDLMTYEQVWAVLVRVPQAKNDLLRITNDKCLVRLANRSSLIESEIEQNKKVMKRLNANSIPYYTLFRGNTDGTVK